MTAKQGLSPTVWMPDPLPSLRHAYWNRTHYQKATLRLNNQIKAIQRQFGQHSPDAHTSSAELPLVAHLEEHRAALAKEMKRWEKNLVAIAADLPCRDWVDDVRGFGPLSFAQVIAETGDLANYAGPAKVWKRMGLAVVDGKAQRRVKDKKAVELMGYNPRRRKVMYLVADNLVKLNDDGYRSLYDERKVYEAAQHPELTKGHIDKRAKRYIAKELLKDLWREWNRGQLSIVTHREIAPSTPPEEGR